MDIAKKRLRDVIDYLDESELKRIDTDLAHGGLHLRNFVQHKIKERETEHHGVCTNCQNDIDPHSSKIYTLIFGPSDFRKKATFCGSDCLLYFLNHLSTIKKG